MAVPDVQINQPVAGRRERMDVRAPSMRPAVAARDEWPAALYAGLGHGSLTTYHLMLAATHAAYVTVSLLAVYHHLASAWVAWRRM